jgi:hypothetical protein
MKVILEKYLISTYVRFYYMLIFFQIKIGGLLRLSIFQNFEINLGQCNKTQMQIIYEHEAMQ